MEHWKGVQGQLETFVSNGIKVGASGEDATFCPFGLKVDVTQELADTIAMRAAD